MGGSARQSALFHKIPRAPSLTAAVSSMAVPVKFVIALLALVSFGMIFGALLQLEFIGGIEESDRNSFPSFRRVHKSRNDGSLRPHGGISLWENDKDAKILHIGFVKPEILCWSPRIILLDNFLSSEGLDGQSDPNSIHGGCEVLGGEKWSATKWMRQRTSH